MTEQYIDGYQIIIITDRPDAKPALAYVTDRAGRTERLTLLDARRVREQLAGRLAVLDTVLGLLGEGK